jgi:hypothetical protein
MTGTTMDGFDARTGEAAERARKRRFWMIVGGCFAAGLPIGFFSAFLEEGDTSGFLTGTLPPWFAVIAAIVTVVAIVGGSVLLYQRIDELDRRDNLLANSMGATVMFAIYPAWYLLWKGRILGEPRHEVLFGLTFGIVMLTYLFLKLRNR